MTDITIKSRYGTDHAARTEVLDRARLAAALTKPWVLPPDNQNDNTTLPENYQSVGSRGIQNLEGKMLMALFPPDIPWFQLIPAPHIRFDPEADPVEIQQLQDEFFLEELMITARLESSNLRMSGQNNQRSGFRTLKRMAITQFLVTGDTLEQLTDDLRLKVFRRDQYVTQRDSSGDVIYHTTRETLDPKALSEKELEAADVKQSDLADMTAQERMEISDLYTHVEWQPDTKKWTIRQEYNEKEIRTSDEKVTPYFSTPFELVSGENYGRGFVELNLGDLRSLNELELKMLDFAAMASKFLPIIDQSSPIRDTDLAKPSGSVVRGRVVNGVVQDVSFLRVDKVADFRVVFETASRKTKDLASAMLIESEVTPQGERVTRAQVNRVAMELDGALGGAYAPIADKQQVPMLERTIHVMRKDGELPSFKDDIMEVRALTGIAALSREVDAAKLERALQSIAQLGEEAIRKIDMDVLVNLVMRYSGVSEPGLVKSAEKIRMETEAMMRQQAQMAAAQKAVDVGGNVAESQLTAGAQGA